MSAGEEITMFKDIVLACATFVGMLVAVSGLNTWKRQLKGGVEYELTRRLLNLTYRSREAVKAARDPFVATGPYPAFEAGKPLTPEQRHHRSLRQAYTERWNKVVEIHDELQTGILEAEVVWSAAIHDTFQPFFDLQAELLSDIQAYLAVADPDITDAKRNAWHKVRRGKRSVMYDMSLLEDDPFADEISIAVSCIEIYLKPHLMK